MTRDPCTNYIIDELVSACRQAKVALESNSKHPITNEIALLAISKALAVHAGGEDGVRRLIASSDGEGV